MAARPKQNNTPTTMSSGLTWIVALALLAMMTLALTTIDQVGAAPPTLLSAPTNMFGRFSMSPRQRAEPRLRWNFGNRGFSGGRLVDRTRSPMRHERFLSEFPENLALKKFEHPQLNGREEQSDMEDKPRLDLNQLPPAEPDTELDLRLAVQL